MIKVSVITVVFNAKDTIARTIQSVMMQSYSNIEYIVIDGGSTDGTQEILGGLKDKISILVSEPDKGIYDAMNKGIRLASGDLIGILNADDFFKKNDVLARYVDAFQDSKLMAVFADVEYFDKHNINIASRRYRSKDFNSAKLANGVMPAHPSLYLRREIFERFGLYDPSYRIAGDFEYIARVFKGGDVRWLYIPDVVVRMQVGGVSTPGLASAITLNGEILRACKKNGIRTNYLRLLMRYPKKITEYFF